MDTIFPVQAQLRYGGLAAIGTMVFFILNLFIPRSTAIWTLSMTLATALNAFFIYGFFLLGRRYRLPMLAFMSLAGIAVTIGATALLVVFAIDARLEHVISIVAGGMEFPTAIALLGLRKEFGALAISVATLTLLWGIGLTTLAIQHILNDAVTAPSIATALFLLVVTCALNITEAVLLFRAAKR